MQPTSNMATSSPIVYLITLVGVQGCSFCRDVPGSIFLPGTGW